MIYTVQSTIKSGHSAKVFVNGNYIPGAFYADTAKGIVRFFPLPLRIKKPDRDRAYSRTLRGSVTVELTERT